MVKSISVIIALSHTSLLLRQAVLLPSSNEWALALSQLRIGSPLYIRPERLIKILGRYQRSYEKDHGEPPADGKYNAEQIIKLFVTRFCSKCACKCFQGKVYWGIVRRACKVCIHMKTIKESALLHVTRAEEDYNRHGSECFKPLRDLDGRKLHSRSEKQYWMADLEYSLENEPRLIHYEEIGGLSYMMRRYIAIQEHVKVAHSGKEKYCEDGYCDSEEGSDGESVSSDMYAMSLGGRE